MIKKPDGSLIPAFDEDQDALRKVATGTPVRVELVRQRNWEFHKKFFALIKVGFENQDRYLNPEAFRAEVIIQAGFVHYHYHLDGTVSKRAQSISWASMDEDTFSKLYSNAIDVILHEFMAESSREDIDDAVMEVISFAGG